MEHYIVSARKYRPSTFESVVGQKALTATLKNAIATSRLAHAYLFCGSRGVGKTSCARIFAKTINCEHPTADGEACNGCESCRQFNENRSMNIIELDAASHNGIEDIKNLIDQVQVPPTLGRYRVFIIDEVHMLSQAAFNAFLKTLEEPPEHAIFILATTEKHKIIPTILSRCQIYDFSRISTADMVEHMGYVAAQEGIEAEPAALGIIARQADGAMRDALSIFDQVAASQRGHITYAGTVESLNVLDDTYYDRLTNAFLGGDVTGALLIYKEVRDKGFDSLFFLNGLAQYVRDLMVASSPATLGLLDSAPEVAARMAETAARCPVKFYYRAMELLNDADLNWRTSSNKQFLVELTLIRLCQLLGPSSDQDAGDGGQKPALRPIKADTVAPRPGEKSEKAPEKQANAPAPGKPAATEKGEAAPAAAPAQVHDGKSRPKVKLAIPRLHEKGEEEGKTHKDSAVRVSLSESPSVQTVEEAWQGFVDSNPEQKALTASMASARLETAGDTVTAYVTSPAQERIIVEALAGLTAHMRRATGNGALEVTAKVADGNGDPVTWTQAQVLEHIVETHPEAEAFIKKMQLTLE